jgi:hypothetical protein
MRIETMLYAVEEGRNNKPIATTDFLVGGRKSCQFTCSQSVTSTTSGCSQTVAKEIDNL